MSSDINSFAFKTVKTNRFETLNPVKNKRTDAKHKKLKNLTQPSQNLRNFMSEEELLFTSLAEMATKRIGEKTQAFGFAQNRVAAEKGGKVAKNARIDFEEETGVKVVSPISSKDQSITNERLMG